MKRKIVIFVFAAAMTAMLIFLSQQGMFGQAQPDQVIKPQTTAGYENLTLDPTTHKPVPANATVQPPPVDEAQQLGVSSLLNDLKQKALTLQPMNQPGWYLFESEVISDIDAPNNGILATGAEIPTHYTQETWMNFDAQGRLIQQVTLMKTMEGQVFQAGVTSDGKGWNSTTGEIRESIEVNFSDMLVGLHDQVMDISQVSPVVINHDWLDGQDATLFVNQEIYQQPLKLDVLDEEVTQSMGRYSFNNENGLLVKYEIISTLVDGSQRTVLTTEYSYSGYIPEPSAEVAAYLDKVEGK
ncbi:MAG: hypothetical protein ACYC36_14765 [Bellilinea sp.]